MEDNTLVKSSFSAAIQAPIEQVDIPTWCFSLSESEYQMTVENRRGTWGQTNETFPSLRETRQVCDG
jgi:hypothetical protein